MAVEIKNYPGALVAYRTDLKTHPNRFNGLYGAGLSAEKSGDESDAKSYYQQLLKISMADSRRPELVHAKRFLKK